MLVVNISVHGNNYSGFRIASWRPLDYSNIDSNAPGAKVVFEIPTKGGRTAIKAMANALEKVL